MSDGKLDIFRALAAANRKDRAFYKSLTDEERKSMQPFLVQRWMSGTNDAMQILLLNEFVNPVAFELQSHPELIWDLLIVCGSGDGSSRHNWIKHSKSSNSTIVENLLMEAYGYSRKHASDAVQLISKDQAIDIAEQLGWQKSDIDKLKQAFK